MKRVVLSSLKMLSIFTISIFILIPSVKAKETTETYYNYYFFLENYRDNTNIEKTTVNETAFHRLKLGYDSNSLNIEEVELNQTTTKAQKCEEIYKSQNSNPEWSYLCFYNMWHKLRTTGKTVEYEADGTKCQTKNLTFNDNYFYYHGCHRKVGETKWDGGGEVTPEPGETPLKNNTFAVKTYSKSCASFNRKSEIDIKTTENSDYVYARITRYPASPNINWEKKFDLAFNLNKCPEETIVDGSQTYNPVLYRAEYQVTKNSCDPSKQNNEPKCNSSNSIESDCQKLTIDTGTGLADVTIEQTATITNILTPESIYQGGGIKFGFIYYDTIKWNYADGGRKLGDLTEVPSTMKEKLKENFANQITASLKFDGKSLDNSLIQKKCTRTGNFNEGETVTTICTIFLPNSNVEFGTGKVDYNNSKYPNYGINNQYYTPLTFTGNYQVSATLSGLNVLNPNDADGIEEWTMKFDDEESCKVNVTSRLYEENPTNDKSASYKFIYRPINLNDPFPDRNAGVNWYEWYSKDSNKRRLEESYSKLQYQVTLDNQIVAKIKDYNANHNYLEWDNIENGESKFIDTYFSTKRENLKLGDDS